MKIEVKRWLIVAIFALAPAVAAAQHEGHQASLQATAPAADPAQLAACIEAQRLSSTLLDAASLRVETARQSNQPSVLRSAVEDLQTVLSSVRTQLGTCTQLQATATPAGHDMANMPGMAKPGAPTALPSPGATPAAGTVDPHAGHTMPAAPASASPKAPAPPAPSAHAGHVMPATPARPPTAPPSVESHAAHGAPGASPSAAPARAPSAPRAAPSPDGTAGTASADAHADHVEATLPTPAMSFEELKCTSKVDAKTAPRMLYGGRMYYFCSEQDRAAFAKEPSTYAKAPGPAPAPAHAH